MKDLIRISSAVLTIIAGVVLLILWIVAGNDKGRFDGELRRCRGCLYLFHDALSQDNFMVDYGYNLDLNSWLKNYRDATPILMGFGVIIGVFWMFTGVAGLFAKRPLIAKVYLFAGLATYLIFVVLFAVIVERIQFIKKNYCPTLWPKTCRTDLDWEIRHYYDSTEEFWGASLFCFMLGAYQIAAAIYLCATDSTSDPSVPKKA